MSLKKCQTELLKQIMNDHKLYPCEPYLHETGYFVQKCVGIVKCEHLSYVPCYKFSVLMDNPIEHIKECAELGVIPKICKKCTKCGEAI
jgi:hypothetical protein